MEKFDVAVVQRLQFAPQPPDLLFLIVSRKDFAEAFERDDFRRQFVAAQRQLKLWSRAGNQSKPDVLRKHRAFVTQLVLLIKFPYCIDCWPLLVLHLLAKLS